MENLTKADLKGALKGVATKKDLKELAKGKDLNDLARDVVRIEGKVDGLGGRFDGLEGKVGGLEGKLDGLVEDMKERPARGEFPELLKTALDFVTLKAEHERMKKIIREELNVEV